jgi:hypothetical protein
MAPDDHRGQNCGGSNEKKVAGGLFDRAKASPCTFYALKVASRLCAQTNWFKSSGVDEITINQNF